MVGTIDQQMVDRLTPQIVALQFASREPISVFIESPGGDVGCAEKIFSLLRAGDESGERCQIITVATGLAASAAADILTFGDYALAYPHSEIYYHGTRLAEIEVTYAKAARLTAALDVDGAHFAARIIDACEERFFFRCMALQSSPDFGSWLKLTMQELSPGAVEIARDAHASMEHFRETIQGVRSHLQAEAGLLKALVNKRFPKATESVTHDSILETLGEFFILRFYSKMLLGIKDRRAYQKWLDQWTKDDAKFKRLPDGELKDAWARSFEATHVFWLFLLALCRRLQQRENSLTASDAFHLGLIDEVIGLPGGRTLRTLVEYARDS